MKHPVILVMGVAGSGKTDIAKALAHSIGAAYLDADDCHSKTGKAHMAAGKPLTDPMRWSWLDEVGEAVKLAASESPVVLACSALKRIYRDYLRASFRFTLVFPDVTFAAAQKRLSLPGRRKLPARFLRNQFDMLGIPTKDEAPIIVAGDQSIDDIVKMIRMQLP